MYEVLYQYISYFEKQPDVGYWKKSEGNDNGCIVIPTMIYYPEFSEFVKACVGTDVMNVDYISVLDENNCLHLSRDEALERIRSADLTVCRAILTKCLREERFNEGSWEINAKNGIFLSLLKRLKELS